MAAAVVRLLPPGASTAGAGFEQPFEMLDACHERVHRMLGLLAKLRTHVAAQGVDEQARQAAVDVMRYFDRAAPEHHRDEELHVFPALLAQGDPAVAEVVARLRVDHVRMESLWAEVREVLAAAADARVAHFTAAQEALLGEFEALYAPHLEAEDGVAYPAARAAMDALALARMSEDMMRRRGVVS